MGCDMVVAVGSATANGKALFGSNCHNLALACHSLRRLPRKEHALGEMEQAQYVQLPQARQTFTVLGCQPPQTWGFSHGINEHCLAAGCSIWSSKVPCPEPGLTGTDLVRLLLERCHNARQGFDLLTSLIAKYGQGQFGQGRSGLRGQTTSGVLATVKTRDARLDGDHVFLVADPAEAYVVEAAGSSWASLQCHEVRAVSDVGLIRQDWQRISPGLADLAIAKGWWHDDGSKLDFSASLSEVGAGTFQSCPTRQSGLRRWGRATFLLEQQNGSIDSAFLRRLLADHYDGTPAEVDPLDPLQANGPAPLCRHSSRSQPMATTASLIAELAPEPEAIPVAWCAYGPPCASVYVPVFLDGELPEAFTRGSAHPDLKSLWWQTQVLLSAMSSDSEHWSSLRHVLAGLQTRIDQETEDFLGEYASLRQAEPLSFERQAGLFMQNHAEQLETEFQRIQSRTRSVAASDSRRDARQAVESPWL